MTTQINGIRWPSLLRERLLPERPDGGCIRRAMDEDEGGMVRPNIREHGRYSKHSAGLLEWMVTTISYRAIIHCDTARHDAKVQGHGLVLTSVTGQVS